MLQAEDEVPVDEVRVLELVRAGAARGMLGMFARALFGRAGCSFLLEVSSRNP